MTEQAVTTVKMTVKPTNPAQVELGGRVRQARRAQGQTQLELAELVGRSESWVRGVERGRLVLDRHSVIDRLAEALKIDVTWLLGQPYGPRSPDQDAGHRFVPALRIAIRRTGLILSGHPGITASTPPRAIPQLRRQVAHLTRLRQAADLPAVMAELPGLLECLNTALLDSAELDDARSLLVEASHAARMVLNQLGHHDLAWTAVENAATAASGLGDELVQACSAWDRCGVLLHTGSVSETITVAQAALDRLEPRMARPSAPELSLHGALHLRCAVAAARQRDAAGAWQHLAEAETSAGRLGADRNDFQTVFGPTNVQIHAVEIAVELGQPALALRRAAPLRLEGIPSQERVVRNRIDVARAYGQLGQDEHAVRSLTRAARLSPHYVHNHPMVRALATQLLQRSKPTAVEAGLGPLTRAMNLT